MNRNIKRVAFALIISAGSFLGTVLWFNSGQQEAVITDREPVALLNESTNEVQRKPVQRVIWENVTKNESLYAGEAIRTTSTAEAKIRLLKSGTVIHLEPDSLVVLEENEKGLSLDFLEGNLYVQSSGDGKSDNITLKSGASEVKLNSADLSLSREQSGAVNMAVYKGQAELQQGGKKIALDKESSATLSSSGLSVDKDRIQVLSPTPGEAVLLNLVRNEQLEVSFKPVAAGYKIGIEWGASRSQLKPLEVTANGETGKLNFETKSGKWFMRLVAKSEDPNLPPMSSNVMPINIGPKSAPTLVEPNAGEPVIKGKADGPIAFRWINRHKFVSQVFEVASDQSFQKIVVRKDIADQSTKLEHVLPEGAYFWRVTGFVESQGKKEALVSPVASFTAQDKWELRAPQLAWPNNKQLLTYVSTQKEGVLLKWQAPMGVKKFDVLVRKKKDGKWENFAQSTLDVSVYRMIDPQPGAYQWRVSSRHPENESKKDSEVWSFNIGDMPKVDWAEAAPLYEYSTPTPTLRAQWKPSDRGPSSYRYKVVAKGSDASSVDWQTTKDTFFEAPVAGEGEYVTFVEALNDKAQTVAQSDGKTFNVKKFLLLPAPNWAQNTPETLQTDAKGNLSFAWEQVNGADHYIMSLEDGNGKTVEKRKVTRTTASVNRLRPGQYKVLLRTVDSQKRIGDKVNTKPLVVPDTSDINAPKIKSIKVK